jgi:hypothetical protein
MNLRLAAVRRLASEASDNGLLNPDIAAGIRRSSSCSVTDLSKPRRAISALVRLIDSRFHLGSIPRHLTVEIGSYRVWLNFAWHLDGLKRRAHRWQAVRAEDS